LAVEPAVVAVGILEDRFAQHLRKHIVISSQTRGQTFFGAGLAAAMSWHWQGGSLKSGWITLGPIRHTHSRQQYESTPELPTQVSHEPKEAAVNNTIGANQRQLALPL
jgi:hypothetical protein